LKIDPHVEALVRTALDAAVKRDFDELNAALRTFRTDDAVRMGGDREPVTAGSEPSAMHSDEMCDEPDLAMTETGA
jgi:hypothetical protein